jgi:anthranilate phosphoribosyltransferase
MPICIKMNVNFTILHSLDGRNIVDQPHKIITSSMEGMISNESFDIGLLSQNEIEGGKTIDESAQMFTNIISGRNRGPKQRSF